MSQFLLPFVDCPDCLAQELLGSNGANTPQPGCSVSHTTSLENNALPSGRSALLSCVFCCQTFTHQDELDSHILTGHRTTVLQPNALLVEAQLQMPWETPRLEPSSLPVEKEEVHSCVVCGQVSQDAQELEFHMRKHKKYFPYCCDVCGQRYKEPQSLKNHMKMHAKLGRRDKAEQDLEPPKTINGVVQDPSMKPVVTSYEMCLACGFFFPDRNSLAEHSNVHHREVELDKDKERLDGAAESQESFLQCLNLKPCAAQGDVPVRTSKWIPQLDPFVTYQTWQLATKEKAAVHSYKLTEKGQKASADSKQSGSDKEQWDVILAEEKNDEEGPVTSAEGQQPRAVSQDQGGQSTEEGFEETLGLVSGKKAYKCVYCDHSAARKASLKCHIDRCHKDQRPRADPQQTGAPSPHGLLLCSGREGCFPATHQQSPGSSSTPCGPSHPTPSEALSAWPPLRAGLDLLHFHTPGYTVQNQHSPGQPNLQGEPTASTPNQHYGTSA